MKKVIKAAAAVILVCSLCACSTTFAVTELAAPTYPAAVSEDNRYDYFIENKLTPDADAAVRDFGYKTASQILSTTEGNTVVSPVSLYFALSLAASGARGETQSEMLNALGFDNAETLSEQSGKLYRRLYTDDEYTKLKIANSLWIDDICKLNNESGFAENAAKSFYASSHQVDFQKTETAELISKWISDNTNGLLKPEINTGTEEILSIINTIYFKTEWTDRFDKTKNTEDIFHGTNGDKTTTFMNETYGSHGFQRGDGWTKSSLGLKGGGSAIFILPDENVDVRSLIDTPEKVKALFDDSGDSMCGEVVFKIPKLETDTDLQLSETLKALGVKSAFEQNADFSGITSDMAFISNIRQQTKFSMNEDGIEAASFTSIEYCGAAMPTDKAEIILDRPFIYAVNNSSGGLLFIGIYVNVE